MTNNNQPYLLLQRRDISFVFSIINCHQETLEKPGVTDRQEFLRSARIIQFEFLFSRHFTRTRVNVTLVFPAARFPPDARSSRVNTRSTNNKALGKEKKRKKKQKATMVSLSRDTSSVTKSNYSSRFARRACDNPRPKATEEIRGRGGGGGEGGKKEEETRA